MNIKYTYSNFPVRILLVFVILLSVNILANYFHGFVDLTEEKRFTLTEPTRQIIRKVPDVMLVRVLLDGEFPAGFKLLQQGAKDMLNQFKNENAYIEYHFENPSEGSNEEINRTRESLAKEGILPTNLKVKSGSENKEKLIYPYAIFNYGERRIAVNLLENVPDLDQESNISNSIALLEYKFGNAIDKILRKDKKNILFTKGNGEMPAENSKTLESYLRPLYNIGRINLDSQYVIHKDAEILIVNKPILPFSERSKFIIDQYIMNGGKVIWMVDGMKMSLDSMTRTGEFIPEPLDLNLADLFFKYGVRIQPNLVLDLECARIPQVIGKMGDKPQIEYFPWYYHPIPAPISQHPIVNNIDRIYLEFPSSIDTIKTKFAVAKVPLIQSSQYSRYQLAPTKIEFDILRYKPDPDKFDKPHQVMGILLEGIFASNFENRVEEQMMKAIESIGLPFKSTSEPTKMIIVSDGDLAKNYVDENAGKYSSMGFNKYDKSMYNGNKDFVLNAIEYLINEDNVLHARSKEIKIRLLDQMKTHKEKGFWQMLNILVPILLLIIFGIANSYWRKHKYASAT